ncbi:50S ribosomal protein L18 [Mahella australiensis]|nr:50S ribosomal protein L18 [Mahella australiensis]
MITKQDKNKARKVRHLRVRKKVDGVPARPRLNVYRSLNHIYAQIIDDTVGHTLVSASTLDKDVKDQLAEESTKTDAAKLVGKVVAQRAIAKGIEEVVFDRGGYIYHGRVKEVATGAREAGLKF